MTNTLRISPVPSSLPGRSKSKRKYPHCGKLEGWGEVKKNNQKKPQNHDREIVHLQARGSMKVPITPE